MSNLDLWLKVEKTDTEFTKKVNQRGGYTAIDPAYQAKVATEQFGAYGRGWGLSKSEFDYTLLESYGLITHVAEFFYFDGETIVRFPITNAINPGKKERPDADWAKKVETNTVSKALSKLGFNADVFLGKFDDTDYIQDLENEQAIANADNADEERAKQEKENLAWLDDQARVMSECVSMNELQKLFTNVVRKLNRRRDEKGVLMITRAKDARKAELEAKGKN